MIDLNAMEYLLALWFVGGPEGDWLAAVYRAKGETDWQLTYRFRWYQGKPSGDPFSDEDRKSWYAGRIAGSASPDAIVSKVGVIASLNALRFGGKVDFVEVNGDPSLLLGKIGDRPWMHVKYEDADGGSPVQTTNKAASA